MINIKLHRNGEVFEGEVSENSNLVVRAGIRQFPYPNLRYKCGMGQCGTCVSRIIAGAENLPEPNWKERRRVGSKLEDGYRLICQLWLTNDLEFTQDVDPLPEP